MLAPFFGSGGLSNGGDCAVLILGGNPQLTRVGNKELLFRGFELVQEIGAAVMQEWRVFIL